MGLIITYGSYLSKKDNIVVSGASVAFLDTFFAFMCGLIVFPALFAMGKDPASGPSLVFEVFPELFLSMPAGLYVGAIFFVLLSIAALTSTISMLEVPVSYYVDEKKYSRKKIVWIITAFAFVAGLPSALSQGSVNFFTNFALFPQSWSKPDFLSHVSFVFGDISLVIGAMMVSIFVGWVWGIDKATDEVTQGATWFKHFRLLWGILLKIIIPVVILVILISLFIVF